MRRTMAEEPAETEEAQEVSPVPAPEEPQVPAAPEAPVAPEPAVPAISGGPLTDMMALEEPARTDALEKALQAGDTFWIAALADETIRISYGEHVLQVRPQARPFQAAHAIHVLWDEQLHVARGGTPRLQEVAEPE